jgi:RNA polymerase sigma factor (sigma-70 family)
VKLPPFQRVIDEHGPVVHRFLMATVGHGDAADCFQETFLAALRAYPDLRNDSNLRGWLMTIANNKATDLFRRRSRGPLPVGDAGATGNGPARAAGVEPADAALPDDGLWDAVRALPPKQREAVVHRFVADLPYAEVGRITGSTEEAARQNVRHGLRRLRKELEQ